MGTSKTKAMQVYLGILTHIQTYSRIIQAYSVAWVNLALILKFDFPVHESI